MFSLTSGDLNDYLAPSLDCVKPVTEKTKTLSLTDCLACSGCITSAEVLLVELHSSSSLDSIPLNKTKTISISQQSRASLAALWNVSSNQAHSILTLFFNSIGIFHVYDVNFARDLSLYHLYQEFKSSNIRPMISGSCPGWICYIEKTHPNLIKNLSTVKSPQQIMASLMKHHLTKKLNVSGSDIYHISIMPCYDKKLEASRLDFKKEDYDVDLVLTTNEILTYMNSKNYIIDKSISIEPDSTYTKTNIFNGKRLLVNVDGSSSGGYAYYIFYKFAASIGIDISISEFLNGSERIVTTVKKDYKIYTLDYNGIKFSVAVIFGFKVYYQINLEYTKFHKKI